MVNNSMKKLNKRLLAMALTGLMLAASIPVTAAERDQDEMPKNPVYSDDGVTWDEDGYIRSSVRDETEWSYIYFGSYPQSEVTDAAMKGLIDDALSEDGGKTTGEVTVDGIKYRKISSADTNFSGYFGSSNEFRYFIWEPIKWKVLQVDEEKKTLFVLADQAIDCQEYNEESRATHWELCTMRKWLNGDAFEDNTRSELTKQAFIETAFTAEQKAIILETEIENKNNPVYDTNCGDKTTDRIFLLSYDEATNPSYGFCETYNCESTSRSVVPTSYAEAMGADILNNDYWFSGNTYWWLRTLGKHTGAAMMCWMDGECCMHGNFCEVNNNSVGVVPAMYLDLSSDLWISWIKHTITFDGNGVSVADNTGETDKDGKVTFPAVTREGYTLKGWFTEKEGGEQVTESTVFTKDMTIYAQWTKNESSSTGGEGGGTEGGGGTDTDTKTDKPGTEDGQQKAGDDPAKQTEVATPGKVTLGSAKNNKKGVVTIKIKTKKTDPKVEGYEVVSAISKKKLSKVKKGKTYKKASIKLTKLKKGKTYFIKVRAFNKDAEGKNVYGEWSKVIKIKVKK